jgi:hypothetical protein
MGIVRTDISEERVASIFMVERIREPETTLAVTSKLYYSSRLHHDVLNDVLGVAL